MKHTTRIPLLVCLALVFLLTTSAFTTSNPQDDKIVFGGSFVLADGETITGNLVILGGAVTLEQDSIVSGDAALIGGTLDADGTVKGNLTVIGGVANLAANSIVNGDVFTLGGTLTRDTGSQVLGDVSSFGGAPFSLTIPSLAMNNHLTDTPLSQPASLLWKVIYFFGLVVFTSALAMLIALLWAKPTQRVANAIRMNPIGTGGFGCLTLIVVPGLLVLVALTIILSPLSLLGMLLMAGAMIFGWVAINLEVGNRLARLFKVEWSAPVAAGIGALVFNFVVFMLALVPCLGFVLVSLAILFALGGVLITRFGTHDYPEGPATPARLAAPITPVAPAAIASPTPVYPEVVKPVTRTAPPKAPAKARDTRPAAAAPAKPAVVSKAKPPAGKAKATPSPSKTSTKSTANKPAGKSKSK